MVPFERIDVANGMFESAKYVRSKSRSSILDRCGFLAMIPADNAWPESGSIATSGLARLHRGLNEGDLVVIRAGALAAQVKRYDDAHFTAPQQTKH
jgi:hypothetical protein